MAAHGNISAEGILSKLRLGKGELNQAGRWFLVVGPLIALLGNSPSDIWLSIIAILAAAKFVWSREADWLKPLYARGALVFWAWIVFVSVLSEWPGNALEQALPWLRFPMFMIGFAMWVGPSKDLKDKLFLASLAGVLILVVVLTVERIQNPDAYRLYGTWGQSTKAGWYLFGMGLPVCLIALGRLKETPQDYRWVLPLVIVTAGSMFNTGEIYMSLAFVFGLGLYILLMRLWTPPIIIGGLIGVTGVTAFLIANPHLAFRFTEDALRRLPWRPESDYYDPWFGGFNTGLHNPLVGVGVDNFDPYCARLAEAGQVIEKLGVDYCLSHPHNLYIQTFAETGLPGFVLLIGIVGSLIWTAARHVNFAKPEPVAAVALVTLALAFWPVSTYSEAFGQHKNFFTWFMAGWALALVWRPAAAVRG